MFLLVKSLGSMFHNDFGFRGLFEILNSTYNGTRTFAQEWISGGVWRCPRKFAPVENMVYFIALSLESVKLLIK